MELLSNTFTLVYIIRVPRKLQCLSGKTRKIRGNLLPKHMYAVLSEMLWVLQRYLYRAGTYDIVYPRDTPPSGYTSGVQDGARCLCLGNEILCLGKKVGKVSRELFSTTNIGDPAT